MARKATFVFVGCGGTFWCASPMLAALVKRYNPETTIFVDPDKLERRNLERQWCVQPRTVRDNEGYKARLAQAAVRPGLSISTTETFQEGANDLREALEGRAVVLVCNVDSDKARIDMAQWASMRQAETVMILSGCDTDYGQVYYGWWKNGESVRDWRKSHPDVTEDEKPKDSCGQNIMSNALSGVLLGLALEEVMPYVMRDQLPTEVKEWYWKREGTALKTWVDTENCEEVSV